MKYLIILALLAASIGLFVLVKRRAREVGRAESVRKRFALDPSEKGRIPLAPENTARLLPNPLLDQVAEPITMPRNRGETGEAGRLVHTPDGEMILTRPPFALKGNVFSSRVGGYVNGLSRRLPAWVVACPRIRMDSLVTPTPPDGRDPTDWSTWRRRVRMRSIDILLCDRRDWKPLLAIMLERPAQLTRRGVAVGGAVAECRHRHATAGWAGRRCRPDGRGGAWARRLAADPRQRRVG